METEGICRQWLNPLIQLLLGAQYRRGVEETLSKDSIPILYRMILVLATIITMVLLDQVHHQLVNAADIQPPAPSFLQNVPRSEFYL